MGCEFELKTTLNHTSSTTISATTNTQSTTTTISVITESTLLYDEHFSGKTKQIDDGQYIKHKKQAAYSGDYALKVVLQDGHDHDPYAAWQYEFNCDKSSIDFNVIGKLSLYVKEGISPCHCDFSIALSDGTAISNYVSLGIQGEQYKNYEVDLEEFTGIDKSPVQGIIFRGETGKHHLSGWFVDLITIEKIKNAVGPNGGTVVLADGDVVLEFPAGALDEETVFTVTERTDILNDFPNLQNEFYLSKMYEIVPSLCFEFDLSPMATFKYDSTVATNNNVTLNSINFYKYDTDGSSSIILASNYVQPEVDDVNGLISEKIECTSSLVIKGDIFARGLIRNHVFTYDPADNVLPWEIEEEGGNIGLLTTMASVSLPSSHFLVADLAGPPTDQGAVNSCIAQTMSNMMRVHHNRFINGWDWNNVPNQTTSGTEYMWAGTKWESEYTLLFSQKMLSPEFLYNYRFQALCSSGTWLGNMSDVAKDHGASLLSSQNYSGFECGPEPSDEAKTEAALFKISSSKWGFQNVDDMKRMLSLGYALGLEAWPIDDHGVTVVGYDDNHQNLLLTDQNTLSRPVVTWTSKYYRTWDRSDDKGAFLVKNSWSTNELSGANAVYNPIFRYRGTGGYFWISYKYLEDHVDDSWGVVHLLQASKHFTYISGAIIGSQPVFVQPVSNDAHTNLFRWTKAAGESTWEIKVTNETETIDLIPVQTVTTQEFDVSTFGLSTGVKHVFFVRSVHSSTIKSEWQKITFFPNPVFTVKLSAEAFRWQEVTVWGTDYYYVLHVSRTDGSITPFTVNVQDNTVNVISDSFNSTVGGTVSQRRLYPNLPENGSIFDKHYDIHFWPMQGMPILVTVSDVSVTENFDFLTDTRSTSILPPRPDANFDNTEFDFLETRAMIN